MKRSRLRNKLFNRRSDLDWNILSDCRNTNIEKDFFARNCSKGIKLKKAIDDFESFNLLQEDQVISKGHQITKSFNKYFVSIPIKDMPKNQEYESFGSSE